ncbi:MAG TPA: HPF/RaiA family ribosome-associated protein [Polyangia bacterium]|nr:HPF/RaiA family ribosome-associated protein [Polyangia bacterium]
MAASIKRTAFAKSISRPDRRGAGRTWAADTPLAVRTSGVHLDTAFRARIRQRVGWRLGKFAPHLERLTVRFEDVNGPRGGADVACKVKAVVSGRPSVVVEETARTAAEAFERVDGRVERAVRRSLDRGREGRLLQRELPRARQAVRRSSGRELPEATPSIGTAARNYKKRTRKAAVALEDSAGARPSRKSTRGSVNRSKHANKLARREKRRISTPQARRTQASRKR